MGCVLPHQSNAVNIPHQTNAGLKAQIKVINIDYFRLVSNFSRNHRASGGLCIFIRNNIETKEFEYLKGLRKEKKVFEITAVELTDIDTILACIYRSPDSDFYEFLHKLQLLILNVSSKGKRLILCGDLKVNFKQHSGKLEDLQDLLLMNNLINVLKSPTRISNHSDF
jgi:exonuclease III